MATVQQLRQVSSSNDPLQKVSQQWAEFAQKNSVTLAGFGKELQSLISKNYPKLLDGILELLKRIGLAAAQHFAQRPRQSTPQTQAGRPPIWQAGVLPGLGQNQFFNNQRSSQTTNSFQAGTTIINQFHVSSQPRATA